MAKYDPHKHQRRSIRLKGYDYTQPGAYFVTIVTQQRQCWFGDVVDGRMRLNEMGKMVQREWERLPSRFESVELDEFVIMPNHIHGIIVITGRGTAASEQDDESELSRRAPTERSEHFGKPVPGSIPTIIRSYKSSVSLRANLMRNSPDSPLWQRNYYEHIIRNDRELNAIRQYIQNNPAKWEMDRDNPIRRTAASQETA